MDDEYYLYDQVILGRKRSLGRELYENPNKNEYNPRDEKKIVKILKYALEYHMGWSPEQTMANLDEETLQFLHLDTEVRTRVRYPVELDQQENLFYLIHLMYPDMLSFDQEDAIKNYYDRIIESPDNRIQKFFFKGDDGTKRLAICFQRMLQHIQPFEKTRDIYDFFLSPEGRRTLVRYKLSKPEKELYQYTEDFIHFSLPEESRDEFYYQKLKFERVNKNQIKALRKAKKFLA